MEGLQRIGALSDSDLIQALSQLAASERRAIALLVAGLAEFDARKLHLGLGYSSLFTYCTGALRLSEQAAFNRIEAARASRRFPAILDCIEEGALSLTATRLLAPHLTAENQQVVLEQARYKKTREVEMIVARLRPLPPVPSTVRKLPEQGPSLVDQAEPTAIPPAPAPPLSRRAIVKPLSPACYRLHITLSADAHAKLKEAQTLSRHSLPNGDPAVIVERGLDALLVQLRRAKFAAASKPREARTRLPHGRRIPSGVKRAVWERDGGRCAFVSATGRRCKATEFIEYHHVTPYARGGAAGADNIELRCRAHNAHEAELVFGPRLNSSQDE